MKKIIYLIVPVIIAIFIVFSLEQPRTENSIMVYHVTLADPKLYTNGIFTDNFQIQKGSYQINFVPNGDSPRLLTIILKGMSLTYDQDFKLHGIEHNTGISTYYTWEYLGANLVDVPEDQSLQIIINPHGATLGSISVELIKNNWRGPPSDNQRLPL